jgi:threonine dehydratase
MAPVAGRRRARRWRRSGLFADGTAVKQVGEETFRLRARARGRDRAWSTPTPSAPPIKDVFEDTRSILEPAGALGVAGVKAYAGGATAAAAARWSAIACGANMNFDRLRFVAERAEVGEQREGVLAVTIPGASPGSFQAPSARSIGRRATITEFNYRYRRPRAAHTSSSGVDAAERDEGEAHWSRSSGAPRLCRRWTSPTTSWPRCTCATWSAAARRAARDERLYRFVFPERPGALLRLPDSRCARAGTSACSTTATRAPTTGACWSGMQVPPADAEASRASCDALGYPCVEETAEPGVPAVPAR